MGHHHVVPKGCLAVKVGHEGEEQHKLVIPVMYVNHPLFMELLKEAEEEFGFDQKGPITIPCRIQEFRNVQGVIHNDYSIHHDQHHHHHRSNHHIGCFH